MTLNTRIYIDGDIGRHDVFTFCQELLAEHDEAKRNVSEQRFTEEILCGSYLLMNEVGQGLPAWLMLYYNPGGPLVTAEQAAEHNVDCNIPDNKDYDADEPVCDGTNGYTHHPAHWLKVSFDTGYSYWNKDQGWGCTALHSYYIVRLGKWLDERNITWAWQNEYTGEAHTGYDGLKEFNENGTDAALWFLDEVLPAVKSGALFKKVDRD